MGRKKGYGFKDRATAERLKQMETSDRYHGRDDIGKAATPKELAPGHVVPQVNTAEALVPGRPTLRTWVGYVEDLPAAEWTYEDNDGETTIDDVIDDVLDDLFGEFACDDVPTIKPGTGTARLWQLEKTRDETGRDLEVLRERKHKGNPVDVPVYNGTPNPYKKAIVWLDQDIFGKIWVRDFNRPIRVEIAERIGCGALGKATIYGTGVYLCVCNQYCGKLYPGDLCLAHPITTNCDTNWSVFDVNRVLFIKCLANEEQCCESGEVQVTQPVSMNCSCVSVDVEEVFNPGHSFQIGDTLHCLWNDHSERFEVIASKGTPVKVLTLVDTLEESGSGDPCVGADTGLKIKSQTICVPVCGSGGSGDGGSGESGEDGEREITLEFKRIPIQYVRMSDNSEGSGSGSEAEENCKLQCAVQEHIILTRSQDDEDCQEDDSSGSESESVSEEPPTCEDLLPEDLEWQTLFEYTWVYGVLIDVSLGASGIEGLAMDIAVPCQNGPYVVDLIPTTECPDGSS